MSQLPDALPGRTAVEGTTADRELKAATSSRWSAEIGVLRTPCERSADRRPLVPGSSATAAGGAARPGARQRAPLTATGAPAPHCTADHYSEPGSDLAPTVRRHFRGRLYGDCTSTGPPARRNAISRSFVDVTPGRLRRTTSSTADGARCAPRSARRPRTRCGRFVGRSRDRCAAYVDEHAREMASQHGAPCSCRSRRDARPRHVRRPVGEGLEPGLGCSRSRVMGQGSVP